jgi:hypothetical protein
MWEGIRLRWRSCRLIFGGAISLKAPVGEQDKVQDVTLPNFVLVKGKVVPVLN